MNFLKLTMIDTPSPRDADASKNCKTKYLGKLIKVVNSFVISINQFSHCCLLW